MRSQMFSLVGAGRFERPTPCAQGGFQRFEKCLIFKSLVSLELCCSLLKAVELFGIRGISHPQFHLQAGRSLDIIIRDGPAMVSGEQVTAAHCGEGVTLFARKDSDLF
jgi:hypothetical protein